MTEREIVDRLFIEGVSPLNVAKAQALTKRMKREWPNVLAAMTDEQRMAVENVK